MEPNSIGMERQRTLRCRLNRLNAEFDFSQIENDSDPRIAVTQKINQGMAALSDAERNAMLDEWGF